jgi:cathepsin A (carboxypeptidase C)/serine carboxypeptidase-like clade 2
MIFIEQPAGVGFSSVDGNTTYDDASSALDNYRFILGFLDRFPEYKANEFYITSESYGGHYLPTLAMQLVQNGGVNFRGLAVGNPLTYMPYRDYGQYATFAGHQLIPKPLWDSYLRTGCAMVEDEPAAAAAARAADPANAEEAVRARKESCSAITDEMDRLTEGLNPYGLDFPVCSAAAGAAGGAEVRALLRKARAATGRRYSGYFPPRYVPCEDNRAATYLNRPDVQAAIHVGRRVVW